jgi:ABC-2 type transport system permease protein
MSAALTIAKREIRTYFNSPVAYIVITVFMLIAGFLFFQNVILERQAEMRGYFGLAPLLFVFFTPAMTMRLIAEEKGSGTIEMLVTMPVRDWEIVVGKFLGALGLLGALVGMTFFYAISLMLMGPADRGPIIAGYIGLFLMGGAYIAIGVMASAFTRNQIVSFIIALFISFCLFIVGNLAQFAPAWLQPIVAFLSMGTHFDAISRGVLDSRDVLYYVSVMAISLVVATVSLEARKWN